MWYAGKGGDGAERFIKRLRRAGIEKCLRAEFAVASPGLAGGLSACGVIVVNPPWRLAAEIRTLAPALLNALGRDSGRGYVLEELAPSLTSPASGGGQM